MWYEKETEVVSRFIVELVSAVAPSTRPKKSASRIILVIGGYTIGLVGSASGLYMSIWYLPVDGASDCDWFILAWSAPVWGACNGDWPI